MPERSRVHPAWLNVATVTIRRVDAPPLAGTLQPVRLAAVLATGAGVCDQVMPIPDESTTDHDAQRGSRITAWSWP